jgi:hypothetical protein
MAWNTYGYRSITIPGTGQHAMYGLPQCNPRYARFSYRKAREDTLKATVECALYLFSTNYYASIAPLWAALRLRVRCTVPTKLLRVPVLS